MARLKSASSPAWLTAVLADFDAFLPDHANCERKAAALAMALVSRYPDRPAIVDAMLGLAQEELGHFHAVYRLMVRRNLALVPDAKDPYVGGLRRLMRHGRETQLVDQLLVAGVIESRGAERFALIAGALPPGELKAFYLDIARSEARHGGLFVRLARTVAPAPAVAERLDVLLTDEADLLAQLPIRATFH